MADLESELREPLLGDDDEAREAALNEHFEPVPGPTPFMLRWSPRADGTGHDPASMTTELRERVLGWANEAQRMWRSRRFERKRAENPDWPVVVCEGDSWVAHPTIADITDHLLDDDRYPVSALGVGAAADLLGNMEVARDHERAVEQHHAAALVLSGGGNDLALAFHAYLRSWMPGTDPERLLTPAVDESMDALMVTMKRLLVRARKRMPGLPIIVHGYDYLRAGVKGAGTELARWFDRVGVVELDERRAVLRAIVDRYNLHLRDVVACVEGVSYVDVRGVVTDDAEWHDEIHPTGDGFGQITERIAEVLLERIADARRSVG